MSIDSFTFRLSPSDSGRLALICGQMHSNIKQIENHLRVKISHRGHQFNISGDTQIIQHAAEVIKKLYETTKTAHKPVTAREVHLVLLTKGGAVDEIDEVMTESENDEDIIIRLRRHVIEGRNKRQRDYLRNIRDNDINFGIGPAGTGKTYLAVACAVKALTENQIERILLVRPAVEAGEKLGFLPGDIGQKIDPYLRPLFDALYEMLGFDRIGKLIARGTIELAPLAYMRGRTLNESFVILDEAQNTTIEQMKMFLTRIGFGSKAIITGDITQIDLPKGQQSGLRHCRDILADVGGISFIEFKPDDVVRHPLVQRIVQAYEKHG